MELNYQHIVGNEAVHRLLKTILTQGKTSHASLFTGAEGVGKATTAKVFAKSLLCDNPKDGEPCEQCSSCRKFESGNHPDFHGIDGERGTIKIEQIRDLQKNIYLKAYESENRVYLIDRADNLTTEAANSLLKILEEPPARSYFILTSHRPFALLPTVISRCQQFNFQPVNPETLESYLVEVAGVNEVEAKLLALLAGGCPGKAYSIINTPGLLDSRVELVQMLTTLLDGNDWDQMKMAEHLEKSKDRLDVFIEFITLWYRDLLVWKECQNPDLLVNIDMLKRIENLSQRYSKPGLLGLLKEVGQTKKALAANANVRLVLDNLVFRLATQ